MFSFNRELSFFGGGGAWPWCLLFPAAGQCLAPFQCSYNCLTARPCQLPSRRPLPVPVSIFPRRSQWVLRWLEFSSHDSRVQRTGNDLHSFCMLIHFFLSLPKSDHTLLFIFLIKNNILLYELHWPQKYFPVVPRKNINCSHLTSRHTFKNIRPAS